MNSATPAFLALLLVCSLPVMALATADPGTTHSEPTENLQQDPLQQPQLATQTQPLASTQTQQDPTAVENTTNRLELPGAVRNEHAEYAPGLGMELAQTDDELRIDADQYALVDREFDQASIDERETMLEDARDTLRERSQTLEEREKTAVRAHANGDLSNSEFLATLLRNSHEAETINEMFEGLEERADTVPGYSISNPQSRADKEVPKLHRTPIRATLEAASHASIDASEYQVQIRTAESGYSLSMIDGNSVLMETKRFDNRDTDASDQFGGLSDAVDQGEEFYPWAFEQEGDDGFFSYSLAQLYSVRFYAGSNNHVEMYLDGGTGEVHREYQELALSELPVAEQREWTDGGLEVTMNETPVDGPVEVTVTEASSGDPEAATIRIDGVEVGETDPDDGTLWYVPPTEEYELSIETSTRSISTTVGDE